MYVIIHGLLAGIAAPPHDLAACEPCLREQVHRKPVPEHVRPGIFAFIGLNKSREVCINPLNLTRHFQ